MDYLDPKKRKSKKIRLLIGYALLGVMISMATVILVYIARGYYVDSETGDVIQNGLLYVDTKPESARIFLNGIEQGTRTDARLVIPEGSYTIELQRDGYHTWTRTVRLDGGSVRQVNYPRLVPQRLDREDTVEMPFLPYETSQSMDARWLVMAFANNPYLLQSIDLSVSEPTLRGVPLQLDTFTLRESARWEILEWADDQNHFLARYGDDAEAEYMLINRSTPDLSVNISTIFEGVAFDHVSLRDKKNDQLFLHDSQSQVLFAADVSTQIAEPYLQNVIDYRAVGRDTILYVTDPAANDGLVRALLQRSSEEVYEIKRELTEDTRYTLDLSLRNGSEVAAIGAPNEDRVIIFDDPIGSLDRNDFSDLPIPTTVLRVDNPRELTISSDSSVVVTRSGDGLQFAAHEFEEDRSHRYEIVQATALTAPVRWVDGRHFIVAANDGTQFVSDFDGNNVHSLGASTTDAGSYFDSAQDFLYSFNGTSQLVDEDNASSSFVSRTYMRTTADR